MVVLANLIVLLVVWTSHSSLTSELERNAPGPGLATMQGRLEAAEAQMRRIESAVGEQGKDMRAIKLGEVYKAPGVVDLAVASAQVVGKGFAVTKLQLEPLSNGYFLRGRLINLQSVEHQNAIFRITVGQESKNFEIASMGASESHSFSVFLADPGSMPPRYARIDYRESVILYRSIP